MLSIKVELLEKFNRLCFAISGGKDSMTLLHWAITHLNHDKFYVITVHHNLRGKEGERDRDFVKEYCLKNNIACDVYEEQIKEFCDINGYTIEQGARIRRRQIFKEIVDSKKADRVVTAHQQDDQIESIFIITNSEINYKEMALAFEGKTTYQLYRDYLDNFRLNVRK